MVSQAYDGPNRHKCLTPKSLTMMPDGEIVCGCGRSEGYTTFSELPTSKRDIGALAKYWFEKLGSQMGPTYNNGVEYRNNQIMSMLRR